MDYEIAGHSFSVDLSEDKYGDGMWGEASRGNWESATIGFILGNAKPGTVFIDVGAASGIFSILAAKLGARVIAIEPHPVWARVLRRNVKLNGLDSVRVMEGALADEDGTGFFDGTIDPSILSSSVLTGNEADEKKSFEIYSLGSILKQAGLHESGEVFLKMDIEGAEYRVLLSAENQRALKKLASRLFISLHPGFPYQRGPNPSFAQQLREVVLGMRDNLSLYHQLTRLASFRLPNGRQVTSALHFILLTRLGVHDFILDFR